MSVKTTKRINRREFLWGLSQSALALLMVGRASELAVASSGMKSISVVVLGAGLSGLYTAMLLEERGLAVTVLEARDRVGGRVYTLDDLPGKPEAGGQSFSEKYQRLLRLTQKLGVPVETSGGFDRELLLHVNGQSVLPQNWASSPANKLAEKEKNLIPPLLLSHYLSKNNPLEDATAWTSPRHFALDIPLDEFLRAQGASPEAMRLMNVNASLMNSLETTSTLWALRNNQRSQNRGKQSMHIKGGNSRLPEKMAASLKFPVQTNKVVVAIRSRETGVEVHCADGTKFEADYAVCTLPFCVLRQVEIDPPLEEEQAKAVEKLPYTAVTQIRLLPRRPFWEEDNYPPRMWTDSSLLQRVFPLKDAAGPIESLVCWVNGVGAKQLDGMSAEELGQFIQSELREIRPAMEGNIEILRIVSWGRDPYALGAYSHFAPGQISQFRDRMVKPWKRIHFAGEHTAIASLGMEAALESAERVVEEIFALIPSIP